VLEQDGKVEQFRAALDKMIVASIGPTASERLRHYNWLVDFEPSHPKMGVLIKELSEQIVHLLLSKRTEPEPPNSPFFSDTSRLY
jgi:uroporphyrinogen-III synthase